MAVLRLILGDQLSVNLPTLEDAIPEQDTILLAEVWQEAQYVKHHKKKIAFLFSAMRHFAQQLRDDGFIVRYVKLDDPDNTGSLESEVARALEKRSYSKVVVTEPGEYRLADVFKKWQNLFEIDVEIRADSRFLAGKKMFTNWAENRKQLRMEYFYREMRKHYGILMAGDQPEGDRWNFDAENRKPPKGSMTFPTRREYAPDKLTREVLALVADEFGDHFGDLEPFYFAVTRKEALKILDDFIEQLLPGFGDYQDAMITGEPWMYHSAISFYLNCGLLEPMECIKKAEAAYYDGAVPLNACEGFIRQILGWREYIRGLYWLKMPDYESRNYLNAQRKLPEFFWSGETTMNCLKQCIEQTSELAYAHHIQRLMVLGNFLLLAGIKPRDVNEWYLIVYADAYQWVELPNVTGMILYADGGLLASKPYAASGAYINKMSNYCKDCQYSVSKKSGEDACPFNYLYWNFYLKNEKKLRGNPRLSMTYRQIDSFDAARKKEITTDAVKFLDNL